MWGWVGGGGVWVEVGVGECWGEVFGEFDGVDFPAHFFVFGEVEEESFVGGGAVDFLEWDGDACEWAVLADDLDLVGWCGLVAEGFEFF